MQPLPTSSQSNRSFNYLPGGSNQKKLIIIAIVVVAVGALGIFARDMFSRYMGEGVNNIGIHNTSQATVLVGANAALPSDWPSDVPVMVDAKISYSGTTNPTSGKTAASAMFTTTNSVADVSAYYNRELPNQGWKIDGMANYGWSNVFSAKKDSRAIGITIVDSQGTTTVNLAVQKE